MTNLKKKILLTNLDKKLTRKMEKVITNTRAFKYISKSELNLRLASIEPRIDTRKAHIWNRRGTERLVVFDMDQKVLLATPGCILSHLMQHTRSVRESRLDLKRAGWTVALNKVNLWQEVVEQNCKRSSCWMLGKVRLLNLGLLQLLFLGNGVNPLFLIGSIEIQQWWLNPLPDLN